MQSSVIRTPELVLPRYVNSTLATPSVGMEHGLSSCSVRPPQAAALTVSSIPPIQLLDCGDALPVYATQDRRNNCPISSQSRWRPSILSRARPMISLSPLPEEGGMKECCSRESCILCMITVTTFRWVLLFFALVGIGCIVSGVVLGAMHTIVGSSFLTLSIMFIGEYFTLRW